jgi:hypothetical protein
MFMRTRRIIVVRMMMEKWIDENGELARRSEIGERYTYVEEIGGFILFDDSKKRSIGWRSNSD